MGNSSSVRSITIIDSNLLMCIFISAPLILKQPDPKTIDQMFNEFGPTPRICLNLIATRDGRKQYSTAVEAAIRNLTLSQLEAFMDEDIPSANQSHKVFLVRRTEASDVSSAPTFSPITDMIARRLTVAFRGLERADQVQWYRRSIGRPGGRAFGGMIYEPYYSRTAFNLNLCQWSDCPTPKALQRPRR
jgi:hypothetical protein